MNDRDMEYKHGVAKLFLCDNTFTESNVCTLCSYVCSKSQLKVTLKGMKQKQKLVRRTHSS